MLTKVIFLVIFFGIMIAVGVISRKHATNVNDFVLGGRSVGPWLTAFAYGTSDDRVAERTFKKFRYDCEYVNSHIDSYILCSGCKINILI